MQLALPALVAEEALAHGHARPVGEPGEVFEEFTDPRFLGAGPPRGAWVGARVKW